MAPTREHARKKVAIVGGGSAGLGALWALNRTHHDVYIYEAAERLGGHTNTVEFKNGNHKTLVDTGFIVLNSATSRMTNFMAFLKATKVPTRAMEMTFGVSRDRGSFEWASASLSAVFAQWSNILYPRLWRMIFDIIRFNQFALDLLKLEERSQRSTISNGHVNGNDNGFHNTERQETIGEYLSREGYSYAFRDDYLIPMTASIWGISPEKSFVEFPATTLVRLMWNHHLLGTLTAGPQWFTLKYGAKSYIDAIMKGFPPNHIFLKTPVQSITNDNNGKVRIHLQNGKVELFDHVIVATHGDQAYDLILAEADAEEKAILSGFQTSQNTAILHSDLTLMPRRQKAWSTCNYITKPSKSSSSPDQACLTYNMNTIQHLNEQTFGHVFVTLNPLHLPDPDLVQARYTYSQPLYNASSIRSQSLLSRIQDTRGISYCGDWTKHGFHEDGFSSGLKVAQDHLGARLPFQLTDSTISRRRRPVLGLKDLVLRLVIMAVQLLIGFIEQALGVQRGMRDKMQVRKVKKSM